MDVRVGHLSYDDAAKMSVSFACTTNKVIDPQERASYLPLRTYRKVHLPQATPAGLIDTIMIKVT